MPPVDVDHTICSVPLQLRQIDGDACMHFHSLHATGTGTGAGTGTGTSSHLVVQSSLEG